MGNPVAWRPTPEEYEEALDSLREGERIACLGRCKRCGSETTGGRVNCIPCAYTAVHAHVMHVTNGFPFGIRCGRCHRTIDGEPLPSEVMLGTEEDDVPVRMIVCLECWTKGPPDA